MKRKRVYRNPGILLWGALLLMLLLFASCGKEAEEPIRELADLRDRELSIGFASDYDIEEELLALCPKAELVRINDLSALCSVETGQLGAVVTSEDALRSAEASGDLSDQLRILDEPVVSFDIAFALSESCAVPDFESKVNDCIAEFKADGTLDDMIRRWLDEGETELPELSLPEDPDYVLEVVTYGQMKPYSWELDGKLVGLEVELAERIAAALNCGIHWNIADYSSMLIGVASGRYDIIASNLYVTEERAETVLFSDPYMESNLCMVVKNETAESEPVYSIADIPDTAVFGSATGTIYTELTEQVLPEVKILEYNSVLDEMAALKAGKIDGFLYDRPVLEFMANEDSSLRVLPELVMTEDYYFLLPRTEKGEALAAEFNEWLAEAKEQGILSEMQEFWTGTEAPEGRIDYEGLGEDRGKGVLTVICTSVGRPSVFLADGKLTGYSVELAVRFARDRGYGVELREESVTALIADLSSGKADLCAGLNSYTEERAEVMLFTDAVYSGGVSVIVKDSTVSGDESFIDRFVRSFEKTFIRDNRWKQILSGFRVTLFITFGGFLLANAFGVLFAALRLSEKRGFLICYDAYSRIMQGTPIVVVLMLLYYVVFGKLKISGIPVAILGFGLAGGAGLAQLFSGAVSSVDKGQREAALALGFTPFETFRGIVFPQAARTALPGYFSQLIALLQGTSVVGYVAVVDLTKASDIIRGATYEALFPLLAVALIYFGISWLLLSLMKRLVRRLQPKRAGKEAAV